LSSKKGREQVAAFGLQVVVLKINSHFLKVADVAQQTKTALFGSANVSARLD